MHLFIQCFYYTRNPPTRVCWKYKLTGPLQTPGNPYVCSSLRSTGLGGRHDDEGKGGSDDKDDDDDDGNETTS